MICSRLFGDGRFIDVVVVLGSIRCSVCDSSKGNMDCVTHPPAAQLCEDYDYCIAVAKYTNDGN